MEVARVYWRPVLLTVSMSDAHQAGRRWPCVMPVMCHIGQILDIRPGGVR